MNFVFSVWNKLGGKFDGTQAASCLHWIQAATGEDLNIPGGGAEEVSQDEFFGDFRHYPEIATNCFVKIFCKAGEKSFWQKILMLRFW